MSAGIRTAEYDAAKSVLMRADPLTWLFRARLGLTSWQLAILLTLALNVPIAILVSLDGAWQSSGGRVGLLRDYNWWFLQLTSIPAGLATFFWLPDGILGVIDGLAKNGAVPGTSRDGAPLRSFVDDLASAYSHWLWPMAVAAGVLIFVVLFVVPEQRAFVNWETAGRGILFYTVSVWALLFWLAVLVALRIVLAIIWLNKLFKKFKIDVKVLHPDRAGGLSPLAAFSIRIGYLIGVLGLGAVTGAFSETYVRTGHIGGPTLSPAFTVMLLVYAIGAPVVFFGPIGAARAAMKAARDEYLMLVSNEFQAHSERLHLLLQSGADDLRSTIDKVEQLEKLHRIVSKFPVWPFNARSMVRFVSAVLWPLILAVVPFLIGLWGNP